MTAPAAKPFSRSSSRCWHRERWLPRPARRKQGRHQGLAGRRVAPIDKALGREHVAKQPGFISRENAHGADGAWLVIVHWRSVKHADASMASFEKAPAGAPFISKIETSTMSMQRYRESCPGADLEGWPASEPFQ